MSDNVVSFKSKDQISLEEAIVDLKDAERDKEFLSGDPNADMEKLKRVIFAQARVSHFKKVLEDRKRNGE